MSAHKALFTLLSAAHPRVYPEKAPQGATKPFIVYHRLDDYPMRHQQGSCALAEASFQVNIVGTTLLECTTLADTIREALDGQQAQVVSSTQIRRISLTSERDGTMLFEGSQEPTTEIQQDYKVWYFRSETP